MSTKPINTVSVPKGDQGGYTESLRMPVSGPITSNFGPRTAPKAGASSFHKGVDIAVPTGTPVAAAASGTVVFAGTQNGYGNVVVIQHDDNTQTKYAHLDSIAVSQGSTVVANEIIGKSGATGNVTGPHLHYEVIKDGKQINPLSSNVQVDAKQRSANTAQNQLDQEAKDRLVALNVNQDDIIKQLISGEHFADNPVNDFDNLTYHWRFFMTVDTEIVDANLTNSNGSLSTFYSKLNSLEQVTIAESGVTTYSIDEVIMEAMVGTDYQTESNRFVSIEMKITEPNGVNFLDSLRNAALKLGVRNYQKCFYYLELTFKGYDANGDINVSPFSDSLPNGGRWLWTVKINDLDVNLSSGGGSYNIRAIPLTDSLLTSTYNLIPSTVNPSGSTVGQFLDDLCSQLNKIWGNIKGDNGIIKYSTKFHPVADLLTADEVRAMAVSPKEQDLNPTQGFDFVTNTNTAQIAQGFTLSRVLDSLMTACEKAQQLATDELIDSKNKNTYRQSILWRLEPEVHNPGYDPLYNEYYQHITLHIYGFRNHSAVLTPQDTLNGDQAQKAILADMARRGFLPKKYEYLFTGVNSEVIDIDLNFNLKWQALLPSLASSTQEQVATQAKANPNTAPAAILPDAQTRRAQAETQSSQTIASNQSNASNSEIKLKEDLLKAEELEKNAPTEDNKKATVALREKLAAAQSALASTRLVTHEKRAQLISARPATLPQNSYDRTFAEDLNQNQSAYNLGNERKNEAFPITVSVYTPSVSDTVGLPGQFHRGKSIYGAVLNQVYGPLASQFFTISLSIKGDPYWIGPGSFEQAIGRWTENYGEGHPKYHDGANCFLFRMKYPLGQDDDGNVIINNNETVTGIYQVNKVTHRFVDGKFTQVLQSTRVAILDLYKALYAHKYGDQ